MTKDELKIQFSFRTFLQKLFITSDLYIQNSLPQNAAACAFGFLFSILPVTFMILIVFTRLLHGNQELLSSLYPYMQNIISVEQYNSITNEVFKIKQIGILEILTGIAIFWMARKFFVTTMSVIRRIFKNQTKRKDIFYALIAYIFEIILIVGIAVIFAVIITVMPFLRSRFLIKTIPTLETTIVKFSISFLPAILLFIFVTFFYKFAPGTKPTFKQSVISAFCSVFLFGIIQRLFSIFTNFTRYNLVYGVLSNLIVLLLEVHIFFQIFLFFAQFIYVSQFFDLLMLGELYLLPEKTQKSIFDKLKRSLFITPAKDFLQKQDTLNLGKGEILFNVNDESRDVYYIVSGTAQKQNENGITIVNAGSFIGETTCLFNKKRISTVSAITDLTLICIKNEDFKRLIKSNSDISAKILRKIQNKNSL